jgi:NDP-4-keto-2,6-dideoxyhexose 3-C-methyltransferase
VHSAVKGCRICGNRKLLEVLDLGVQALTGIFPVNREQSVAQGPLKLVKCTDEAGCCGLLQLAHSYDHDEMYGTNYGYRSGLNQSMVSHLHGKIQKILGLADLSGNPVALDIGSNDGTTLRAYSDTGFDLVGIDPTADKFRRYYPDKVMVVPEFFSAAAYLNAARGRKARIVTSFSMFYDLEDPMAFMREVVEILENNGLWVFEQSYMPTMLERNSYDTVCHEHLEYYALAQVKWMSDRVGLRIVDVEFNETNGGSFSVVAAKLSSNYPEFPGLGKLLDREREAGLDGPEPYRAFAARAAASREELRTFFSQANASGRRVAGLGASTKGNVLLQYCGLSGRELYAIGEVNEDKFGCFTPGSLIPIRPEQELFEDEPDFFLVLPWHFREFFLRKYKPKKAALVFPLPKLDVVPRSRPDGWKTH